MDSIIVNPKNEKELKFISELLEKLGVSNEVFSFNKKEDFELLLNSFEAQQKDEGYEIPEEYYQVLDGRRAEYLKGNSKTSSWEEVKARVSGKGE
ncbi:addiction module protein [Algoriphagus sp. AGSA1]|uniref:addiction module protein n=1 Tax=Algoriphagus sp. AGSA1 TaxID=2907213 RepID=UPI001F200FBE|nr:addiction module protein [Algoriphagus sp. AGSA1]MCE7054370.1 addiction module protein [Algoriphagus sp. AGSA1]